MSSDPVSSSTSPTSPNSGPTQSQKVGRKKSKKQATDSTLAVSEPQQRADLTISLASSELHLQSEVTTPPAGSVSGDGDVNRNPYIEVIAKRVRTIRKKIAKIEKYEEKLADTSSEGMLNADQLASIRSKPELVGSYKEFEEIIKQLEKVEADEQRRDRQRRREADAHAQLAASEAAAAERARSDTLLVNTLWFIHLVHLANQGFRGNSDAVTETELLTILHLYEVVLSSAVAVAHVPEGPERVARAANVAGYMRKLERGEDENVGDDAASETFAKIRTLVAHFVEPQPIVQEDSAYETSQPDEAYPDPTGPLVLGNGPVLDSQPAHDPQETTPPEGDDDDSDVARTIQIPQGGFQFMTCSEIYDSPSDDPPPPNDSSEDSVRPSQGRANHRANSRRSTNQQKNDQYRAPTPPQQENQKPHRSRGGFRGSRGGGQNRGTQQQSQHVAGQRAGVGWADNV